MVFEPIRISNDGDDDDNGGSSSDRNDNNIIFFNESPTQNRGIQTIKRVRGDSLFKGNRKSSG